MNINDLPPAAKVACYIEAGRLAHPELEHGQGKVLQDGRACALGFAALGAGMTEKEIGLEGQPGFADYGAIRERLGITDALVRAIYRLNDAPSRASIHEICQALREGELAKVLEPVEL